jgi:hypothetical protein
MPSDFLTSSWGIPTGGAGGAQPTYGTNQNWLFPTQAGIEYQNQSKLMGQQIGGENYRAGLAAQAAELPAQLQQSRFNSVFPWLQGQFGNFGNSGVYSPGGQSTPAPTVSVSGVYTPQQVQQQVNQSRAQNDQATQGRVRGMQQDLGGRGLGATSPLAQELGAQYQGQNLATNTSNETNLRLGAAQANAGQVLQGQQARGALWNEAQQQDIARRQVTVGARNALLAAISGLV